MRLWQVLFVGGFIALDLDHAGPSCMEHESGSLASPVGPWQACDALR